MTKKESEMKRELAKLYYMQGLPQKEIAQRVDVSETTISAWCRKENWEEMRAAKTVSRQEVVAKMLRKVSERLDDENWTPDELAKISASIEKLDKKTNVVTIVEVFSAYNDWLQTRMRFDVKLSPELVRTMTRYQDLFIAEKFNKTTIE